MRFKCNIFLIFIIILFFFGSKAAALLDDFQNHISTVANDSVAIQKKIIKLYEVDSIAGQYDIALVLDKVGKSHSIPEISNLFNNWIVQFPMNHDADRKYLTEHDASDLIFMLNHWAYIYEAFLSSDLSQRRNISIDIEKSFSENDVYFTKFLEWVVILSEASMKAAKIQEKEENSWAGTAKDIGRGLSLVGLASPDFWAGGIQPRDAVKAVAPYKEMVKDFLPDEWYFAIRQYVDIQNSFYKSRDLLNKLISHYTGIVPINDAHYDLHSKQMNKLNEFAMINDLYFKKLDTLLRNWIFDYPVLFLSGYSYLRCKAAQHWWDDMEEMQKALLDFCSIDPFKYTVNPDTDEYLIIVRKEFKRNFGDEKYNEIAAQVILRKPWYDLHAMVKEPRPDSRFE
jgi:hypothetical protein